MNFLVLFGTISLSIAPAAREGSVTCAIAPVFFGVGSSQFDAQARGMLEGLPVAVGFFTRPGHIVIEAAADDAGTVAANHRLSWERGVAVSRHLIARGIPPDRIMIRSLGNTRPIADGNPASEMNRRVFIYGQMPQSEWDRLRPPNPNPVLC